MPWGPFCVFSMPMKSGASYGGSYFGSVAVPAALPKYEPPYDAPLFVGVENTQNDPTNPTLRRPCSARSRRWYSAGRRCRPRRSRTMWTINRT